ncbi:aspartate/glutamate racemase family protein [Flavobacterium agrisoli]|uniref:Aspartate/glutamate racemase family protein n=1 Tax=Flavobacterium agrisoli TaxID=2793066 RepID=A0A934UIH2_9FLAO|nr:aspartate/glutamate racemase family protein [Flavobacterium agrisoli]MBK0368385.1 aspartate/glutamate racemase family protein [Flavobacterium agrisoli]
MNSKSLGILGLGSRSTLFYIKELNRLYQLKNGGYSTCPFKMWNTNFDTINNLLPEPSEKLKKIVRENLLKLQNMQIDSILVPNITLHQIIDSITLLPKIIHPVSLTIQKLQEKGITKVILFGSAYTMESKYIKESFQKEHLEIVLPSEEDRLFIDYVRKEIYAETESHELLRKYNNIIEKYSTDYAVVLACTELSIVWNGKNSSVFDMARIQMEAAIANFDRF